MVSHICLLVELGPICNSTAASLCLKSCVDHSLLKSYNGGLWKNIYRSGPYHYSDTNACGESVASKKVISLNADIKGTFLCIRSV